jgi:succinate dehydrogenase/fumarate reductase flavoprotein subunit
MQQNFESSSEPASTDFTVETDVVVVGGGGSGLAAAIEARTLGRNVILIEKNPALGGSTARSVGSVTATNTPHQLRKGIRDCPDDHFADMDEFCKRVGLQDNTALRRILIDNVGDTFRWLLSMGVVFHGPLTEPPHRKPRMHNVLPNSRAYIYHLGRRARKLGVTIKLNTHVSDLIIENGLALGVRATTPEGQIAIRALGGVILTTGDFAANPEMRRTYLPARAAPAEPINPTNTGDGHRLVVKAGGRMMNAQHYIGGVRFSPPKEKWVHRIPPIGIVTHFMSWSLDHMPSWLLRPFIMSFLTTVLQSSPNLYKQGAVLINRSGKRFNDELASPADHLAEQPDGVAYILLDGNLAKKFSGPPFQISTAPGIAYAYLPDYKRTRKDIYTEAPTIEKLAVKLRIDPDALAKTIAGYNANEPAEAPASPRGDRPMLDRGPYVALGPVRHYITFSDSGVAVTERHEVIGADGKPIDGLYAAGFIGMGGMLLEGLGHHLGWAFTSGRRAGRFAAYRVVTPDLPPVQ